MLQNLDGWRESLAVLKKRKWLVLLPTLTGMVATGVVSVLMRPVWRIDCLIQSPRIAMESPPGVLREINFLEPRQIMEQINRHVYRGPLSRELNLNPRRFPKIKVEWVRETNLLSLSLTHTDIPFAESVLRALGRRLQEDFDAAVGAERQALDTRIALNDNARALRELMLKDQVRSVQIKDNDIRLKQADILLLENQKTKHEQARASLSAKLKIAEARNSQLAQERAAVQKRSEGLEEIQKQTYSENAAVDNIALLFLYANVVQQNRELASALDEKLNLEKVNQENLRLEHLAVGKDFESLGTQIDKAKTEVESLRRQAESMKGDAEKIRLDIKNLDSEKALLAKKRAVLESPVFLKEPGPSLDPVAPRKKLNVVLAMVLGLAVFTAFAFFLEALQKSDAR